MKERRRIRLRGCLISLSLIFAFSVMLFFALPYMLISSPVIERSDVIIQTAIDSHSESDEYVVRLYQQGFAPKVICVSSQVSIDVYPGDYSCAHIASLGVPPENVRSVRLPLTDCPAQNLTVITDYVKGQGWTRALLVSSPETSRYGGWLARKAFSKQQINLSVTYAPYDKYELTTGWWKEHWKIQRFAQEGMNIPIDLLYPECR